MKKILYEEEDCIVGGNENIKFPKTYTKEEIIQWLDLRFTKDAPVHYVLSELRKITGNLK